MKNYIAEWPNWGAEFKARNLKEAKQYASLHKRMNKYKGKTTVRLKRES